MLRELERDGILRLPPKRNPGRGRPRPLQLDSRTARQPPVAEPLDDLAPLQLQAVSEPSEKALWNQWVERYHPLAYRQPMGAHLCYFVFDGRGRRLACLLFDFATQRLPCRDRWIGWETKAFHKRLHLAVRNSRYLMFPWVTVKNLASQALGLAARRPQRRAPSRAQPADGFAGRGAADD